MEKEQRLKILNEVSRILPVNQSVDPETVRRIRESLKEHIRNRDQSRPEGYGVDDVSVDIGFEFEDISSSKFNDYSLTVDDLTVRNFFLNRGFSRNKDDASKGSNAASGSLRLMAAYLVVSDTNLLTLDNLLPVPNQLSNKIAREMSVFVGLSDAGDGLSVDQVTGIYRAELNMKMGEAGAIQLTLEKSADGSHLLVEEKYSVELKASRLKSPTKTAYGWCVFTSSDVLLIALMNPQTERSSFYSSLHLQLDEEGNPILDNLLLQLHDRHFDLCADSHDAQSEHELDQFVKRHQFVFSKLSGDILTFEQPFDATTRKQRLSRIHGMDRDTRSSTANVIRMEGKATIMDGEEKDRLSKEMLECIIDIAYRDEERFFELLDKGASINYRDPRLKATVMHAVGQYYPEFFEEVLKRSHEEYDFSIRDKNGNLASGWAFPNYPDNPLYEIMRQCEIDYGKKIDKYLDPLGDRPWNEVFPDGDYPKPPSLD